MGEEEETAARVGGGGGNNGSVGGGGVSHAGGGGKMEWVRGGELMLATDPCVEVAQEEKGKAGEGCLEDG